MAQVNVPQMGGPSRGSQDTKMVFQLGGAILGGLAGGVPGAVAGAQAGGAAAGLVEAKSAGEAVNSGIGVASGAQGFANKPAGTSPAMKRRLDTIQTDNLETLQAAEGAAATLPESTRQRILPNLVQARMLEQRKRGM